MHLHDAVDAFRIGRFAPGLLGFVSSRSLNQIEPLRSMGPDPRFLDAFNLNFEDRRRQWGSPISAMSSSVTRWCRSRIEVTR